MGCPIFQFEALAKIYEHELEYLLGKLTPYIKDHRKAKIPIYLDMERDR